LFTSTYLLCKEAFQVTALVYQRAYRMVVVRKNLSVEKGEQVLFDDVRYFFYITNITDLSAAEIVFLANDRCDQENLIEQLKSGVSAMAPRPRWSESHELGMTDDG
jgi:hypothetical protein